MWTALGALFTVLLSVLCKDAFEIKVEREKLMKKEMDMMLGSDIVLNDSEQRANEIIMNLKIEALDTAFGEPHMFNMSKHFFQWKDEVKSTELFQIIKNMPKGAVLHAHDTGILSPEYVLKITYWDDLYVCFVEEDVHFKFSRDIPTDPCLTQWQLMRDARYSSGNVEKFDAKLRQHFSIVIDNPNEVYTDVNKVWNAFQQYFITTGPLLYYKPAWEQYFYDTLKELRDDNIMYIEIRSVLPNLYDLDSHYSTIDTAQSYKDVVGKFTKEHPDFFGAKLIYAPLRNVDESTVKKYIKTAKEIKQLMPDFFAGFDLVGQEDLGNPTKDFIPTLADAANDINFFFHAGETNWYGTTSDENLFNVILLGTKRIGHAFAIVKHPALIEEIKKRDIPLEVNVVSNIVLKLVDDVRNHPLATFIAQGLPVVISSDDPGVWEADPISHDFYVTFVGAASRHADLRLLKKLALNSLYYSTVKNKDKIVHEFEIRWARFIHSVNKDSW